MHSWLLPFLGINITTLIITDYKTRHDAHEAQLKRLQQLLKHKAKLEGAMEAKLTELRASYDAHSCDLQNVLNTRIRELKWNLALSPRDSEGVLNVITRGALDGLEAYAPDKWGLSPLAEVQYHGAKKATRHTSKLSRSFRR
jgi:hypothetical protein